MKPSIFSGIHNPLSPFLLLLALIILATIIISNIQSEQEKQWFRNAAPRELQFDPSLPTRVDDAENQYAPPMLEPDIQRLTAAALDDWARGDFTAAEDKFRTILVFRPNNAVALSHLGALLSHRGDYKNAELMFRNQTLFYPGDPNAYLNLATVLAKQKRLPEERRTIFRWRRSIRLRTTGKWRWIFSVGRRGVSEPAWWKRAGIPPLTISGRLRNFRSWSGKRNRKAKGPHHEPD